ncbi:MAG: MarC family protein [Methanoregulaceae archaeon]|jgi:multiple antibiotic resistance protein|nr:MarC family protein [Methanoregulaceae archaeon]
MTELISSLIYSFAALFVILDPLLSVPIFTSMIEGQSSAEINRQALIAVVVAGFLMYLFLFFNFIIFETLGITIASFQVAGGILLFLLGMQMTLGIDIGRSKDHPRTAAGVVIGTPLLCGPGTITTVLLLSEQNGIFVTALAIALTLAATFIILRFSYQIQRLLGECVTEILAKVLGMLVAAIAVSIIAAGILGILQDYGSSYSFSLNVD